MRIILVTNSTWPDRTGGLERYFRELAETLSARGHNVVLVAKRLDESSPIVERVNEGLVIRRYRTTPHSDPFFIAKYHLSINRAIKSVLRELGAREPGTVIHAFYPYQGEILRRLGLRYLYTCAAPVYKEIGPEHQGRYRMPNRLVGIAARVVRHIERRAIEGADRVVAISEFTRSEIDRFCRPKMPVTTILGGIDTGYFSPAEAVDETPRGLADGGPVLFAARRHVLRTGLENLVLAMERVRAELPNARLYLSGDGPRRPALEALIHEHDLASAVTLLGRISNEDVRWWYRNADICVTPTLELEGFGLSTAEAMACGSPPLVTPVGSNPELVADLPPEHLTRDPHPRGLADGIVALYRALQQRPRPVQELVTLAARWDWTRVAIEYEKLYETVIAE